MNKKFIFLLGSLLTINCITKAQNAVNVNPLTGTANVNIPLYTVVSGSLSLPVSLNYVGDGIKPKDIEGTAGMGWNLSAGGSISRTVRGLPDDCNRDNDNNILRGWMDPLNTYPTYINGFTVNNDGLFYTCSDEAADITYINNYFPYTNDSEPDMFYINAPGLSCQMVYDRTSSKFVPVVNQDIKISYTLNNNLLSSFTIVNDRGITYEFATASSNTQKTIGGTSASYFATKFTQYQHGISYNDQWLLTAMYDAAGNKISLGYTAGSSRSGTDNVLLYIGGSTSPSLQYKISQTKTPYLLSSIYTSNANNPVPVSIMSFSWTLASVGNIGTNQTILSYVNVPGRAIQLGYTYVKTSNDYSRCFLRTVDDQICNSPINYQFSYIGETNGGYNTSLPDSTTTNLDYWGYYAASNGTPSSLIPKVMMSPVNVANPMFAPYQSNAFSGVYSYTTAGNSRAADPTTVMVGSLSKITNAQGGTTEIVYESNDYLDVPSNTVVKGGGIRVKQTIDTFGPASANSNVRNYIYTNASGVSTGKPISLPAFAFSAPFNYYAPDAQTLLNESTVLSVNDLSTEDHTIMYSSVKVKQTGAGTVQYEYLLPATNWDQSGTPACSGCSVEWIPTINYSARDNCSTTSSWVVSNNIASYPFIPNPNYDFERGMIKKVTNFNDSGAEVSESNYTYTRKGSPSVITAVKVENDPLAPLLAKTYGKYIIYYNMGELSATVTNKTFDSPTLSTSITNTETFTYGSINHRLLTKKQVTNSDGSIITNNYSYVKDYTATSGTNPNITAIYQLQQRNINAPVETYQQITRGASQTTVGAALTLYKAATAGTTTNYLPSQQLQFIQSAGVTNFSPYTVNAVNQTTSNDSRYFPVANFITYDNTGSPVTIDNANKAIKTSIVDPRYSNVIAAFTNTSAGEVAINDFDSNFPSAPAVNFTINGTGTTLAAGHTGGAYNFGSSQNLVKTISKNTSATKYIFSIWLNSAGAGSLNIALTSGSTTLNYPLAFNTGGVWKYYELKVPLTSMGTSFSATVTTNAQVGIDDVLFYPDVAEVATFAYDPVTHVKTAQTNTNGISTYFTNDAFGRLLYQFDQDKNIVLRNTYATPTNVQNFTTPVITSAPGTTVNTITPVTLSASNYFGGNCTTAGLTYTWNFGDSPANVITSAPSAPAHTYATAGTYNATLTVTSPFFGSKSAAPVPISVTQAVATISYNNYSIAGGISSVSFSGPHTYSGLPTSVLPGTYTITINMSGTQYNPGTGKGYTNAVFTDGTDGQCFGYTGSSFVFTYTINAGDTINFSAYNNYTCPFN